MPALFDLNWKPSAAEPDLPTTGYPYRGHAVYRNDTYTITITLTDGVDPYEPEGTLAAQVRPARLAANATAGDPLAEFDVDVAVNVVTLTLDREQAASLPDAWYWDLQEVFDDDTARTWFTGKGKAWGDVTREEVAS